MDKSLVVSLGWVVSSHNGIQGGRLRSHNDVNSCLYITYDIIVIRIKLSGEGCYKHTNHDEPLYLGTGRLVVGFTGVYGNLSCLLLFLTGV